MSKVSEYPVLGPVVKQITALEEREAIFGLVLVAPAILLVTITIVYPFLRAIFLSFTEVGTGEFVGLSHYEWVLTHGDFLRFTGYSVAWTAANVLLQGAAGIGVALLLREKFFGRDAVRAVILIPFVVPTAVIALIWRWLLNDSFGPIPEFFEWLGASSLAVNPLADPSTALATVTAINIWRWTPLVALVVFAVLQTIPDEEYEAVRVEGAGIISEFYHVTWPHLKGSLTVLGLLGVLLTFNIFDLIWLLSETGPLDSTMTLPVFIYDVAFGLQAIGRATAVSVILFLMLAVFVIVYLQQDEIKKGDFT